MISWVRGLRASANFMGVHGNLPGRLEAKTSVTPGAEIHELHAEHAPRSEHAETVQRVLLTT